MYYSRYHNNIGSTAMKKFVFYLIMCSCLFVFSGNGYLSSAASAANIPIIPGGKGFGMYTTAGSGRSETPISTTVRKVTNINDSGSGSFRQAVLDHNASGRPSVIVFETSGTIKLTSMVSIKSPNLTIAGQTAPSPGITLRGHTLKVDDAGDILIQHIRIRVGDEKAADLDGLLIIGDNASNIVIDHCSVSWGIDENLDAAVYGAHDVTIRSCLVSEGLKHSVHSEGHHSKGVMIARGYNVAVIYTLMAHNDYRNPNWGIAGNGIDTTAMVANNVIYNWGKRGAYVNKRVDGDAKKLASIVGNVYITGPDTLKGPIWIDENSNTKVYLSDNTKNRILPNDPWDIVDAYNGTNPHNTKVLSPPIWPPGFTTMPVNQVENYVLANAGARPADRDAVDKRIVKEVINGTGRIIDSQKDVGGWPVLAKNYRALTIPGNPNEDNDGDGYTNLEEWLHGYAADVEGTGTATCGDGTCSGTETCSSCPSDCGTCPTYQCNDGIDNDGDGLIDYPDDPGCTSSTDNDEYNEPAPACGDGTCNGSETCSTCPADCDVCPPTSSQYHEAESMSLVSPMTIGNDVNASGGQYISPTSGVNSTSPAPEATLSFNVPNADNYYLWVKLYGPNSQSDALYVGIDSTWDRVYSAGIDTYEWIRVETVHNTANYAFNLSKGTHTFQIGHGEINARADTLFITNDPNEVPAAPTNTQPSPPSGLRIVPQ
jgi:hypothetical protein